MKLTQERIRSYATQGLQLGVALLVVFAIRSSVIEPFKIPSGSMIPTLYVGDFVFVNKFAYGFHLPLSDYFGEKKTLIERAPPRRGDVIVFEYPHDRSIHYIKRVIGLPGDTVELRKKIVYVNGKPFLENEMDANTVTDKLKDIGDEKYADGHIRMAHEQIGGGDHLMMIDQKNTSTEAFGPITVPAENLFVMGDNRDFSSDSRVWGFVPYANISGKAEAIWLSLWINPAQASENAFHPERIGTILR